MLKEILDTIPLEYKTDKRRQELRSARIRLGLVRVVAFAALWTFRKYGCFPEITEVFRTEAEQRIIYPEDPARKSVHQYWRGCDMVIRALGQKEHTQIRDVVNRLFPYGKPGHQTCIYHDVGSGPHLHFQIKA